MVILKKTYKFRAYPSKEQTAILNRQMLLSRQLYNLLLERSQQHFKETGKTFTKYDMIKWTTKFKRENPEYNEIKCGLKIDRDINASKNILKRALYSASPNFGSKTVKATEGHSGSHAQGESVRPQIWAVPAERGNISGVSG